MPQQLKYIGQQAMDNFYASYKSDFQFFDIDDFIRYAGNAISKIYQDYYQLQYRDLRSDRKDEVVTFDTAMLSEQDVEVSNKDGELVAKLKHPYMSFMYDQQNTGIQNVFIIEPKNSAEVERTTIASKWQLNFLPRTNTIWFYPTGLELNFINKGDCNIKKVKVFYIPSMTPDAWIADGIISQAINDTVMLVKSLTDKKVVKKTLDNNENAILETEINDKAIAK